MIVMMRGKEFILVSILISLLVRVTPTTNSVLMASETHVYSKDTFYNRRSLQGGEAINKALSPSYYDDLRILFENVTSRNNNNNSNNNQNESLPIITTDENSSIYQVTLISNNETNEETTYRLAEVKSFIAFTKDGSNVYGAQNEAFAVLLAMYHFNNMVPIQHHPLLENQIFNSAGVDDNSATVSSNYTHLSSCNIKLTIELLDSTYSPTIATQTIASVLERTESILVPQATVVVSSSPTTVTLPLAILTGINDVPLMSATATSTGFDDKEQFPMFGRTVTNADGIAAMSLEFFHSVIRSSHVAILFVTVRNKITIICADVKFFRSLLRTVCIFRYLIFVFILF